MKLAEKIASTIAIVMLIMGLAWIVFANYMHGRPALTKDVGLTRSVLIRIKQGLEAYCSEYGTFPKGESDVVMKILAGENIGNQNPKHLTFLYLADKRFYNSALKVVDWWGNPIVFTISIDGKPLVYSYGKNQKDDAGAKDDIAFVVSSP